MKQNGKKFGSDFNKAATYPIEDDEYDELPFLTDEMLDRGVLKRNGKVIGRPRKRPEEKKVSVHLRLDRDVREAFKATGRGWQSRINRLLRIHMPK